MTPLPHLSTMPTLKDIRSSRELTQVETAQLADLTPGYYNQLENGRMKNARPRTLRKVAKALDCSYEVVRSAVKAAIEARSSSPSR